MDEVVKNDSEKDKLENEIEKEQKANEEEMALMQKELEEARMQTESAIDKMLRLAAEFDNYKKRSAKEHENIRKYASESIIKELLPIVDNFERAIQSANESRDFESFLEGVKLILNQIINLLEKEGVIPIKSVGEPFDPNFHEAVMHVDSDEYPANVVAEEYQKGYILKDRVIRPAMVAVSKGK
ncbi:TPA: nucleotide exchange factor GrpE [Candidatus Poribacteria bacterium]|nr:nucleotide exchange factor GrpE [Candidatus Poribacteria bacterium]